MSDDLTYTLDDLWALTLDELGVTEPGQSISPEDIGPIKSRWPSVVADLNARDVGYYDLTEIEVAALLPLAQIMAYACLNAFSITNPMKVETITRVGGKNGEAEQTLKNYRRLRSPRQTMRQDQISRRRFGGRYGF